MRPSGGQVGPEALQHPHTSAGRQEGDDVAGADDQVERLLDAPTGQVEHGQVAHQPGRPRVVLLGGLDQHGVDIDADHPVADRVQRRADPTGPTPGVQDVGTPADHGVDQPRLAVQVVTRRCHGTEPFDVPGGVVRVLTGQRGPAALLDPVVAAHVAGSVMAGTLERKHGHRPAVRRAAHGTR